MSQYYKVDLHQHSKIIFFVNQNLEIFTEKDKIMINHKMCEIGKKTN